MRQKELRIALVCYGGVSLAVYMHGVTKELWKLARASRAFLAGEAAPGRVESVYLKLLQQIEQQHRLRLRVLPVSDPWALRRMQLVTRAQPPSQTPLGTLLAHLETCAAVGGDAVGDQAGM